MAHEIFGSRFVGYREAAWHKLGTVIPEGQIISVADALRTGGIDFTYQDVPVGYTTPAGEFVQSSTRKIILRSPTSDDPIWRDVGVVSDEYGYLQNQELAAGLDAIAQATGWTFETVGALEQGRTVFLTLRVGSQSVFGDDHDIFLVVSDGKGTGRALTITVTRVRVVCKNTLIYSDGNAIANVRIAHDQAVRGEYDFWLNLIEQIEMQNRAAGDQLVAMASVKVSDKRAQQIIDAAFPLPGKTKRAEEGDALLSLPNLTDVQRLAIEARSLRGEDRKDEARRIAINKRLAAWTLYERFNAGQEQGSNGDQGGAVVPAAVLATLRETPYAALQAVVEVVDWAGIAKAETAAQSAIFGVGADAKKRAWKEALAVAS